MIDIPSEAYAEYVASRIEPWEAKRNTKNYLIKLFSLSAWRRILTGKSNYKLIFRTLLTAKASNPASSASKEGKLHRIFNEEGWNALKRCISRGHSILFILPELDRETIDFRAELVPRLAELKAPSSAYDLIEIPQANHLLTLVEHQEILLEKTCAWVQNLDAKLFARV